MNASASACDNLAFGKEQMQMNHGKLNSIGVAILLIFLPAFALSAGSSVDRWSPELQEAEPFESPFVTIFHYGEKRVCFVSSKHDPRRDSPTSRTIAAVIKECEPEILILEGLPNIISESDREYFVREAENCEQNPDSYECGEFRAYLELIRRIGKAPENILFVDDRRKNVHAARAVGLRSIVFDSRNRLRGDVSGFEGLSDIVAGAPANGAFQIPDS
ncbi:MAG: hypothetical protein OXF94_00235 [Gammaproteobacteria bacterium]|nr:hypothetical protein [Gammaproteobacteria bacterium]